MNIVLNQTKNFETLDTRKRFLSSIIYLCSFCHLNEEASLKNNENN